MTQTPQDEMPAPGPSVGPEMAPPLIDTRPRPEDGVQNVDQDPHFEVADSSDNEEDDDFGVQEIGE